MPSALDIGVSKAKLVMPKSSTTKQFLLQLKTREKRKLQLERYARWIELEADREQRVGYRLRYEIRGPVRIEDADSDLVGNLMMGSFTLCKQRIDDGYLAEHLDKQSQFLWTIHPSGNSIDTRAIGFATVEISNHIADLHIICAARGGMALFVEILKWLKTMEMAARFRLQPVSLEVLWRYDAAVRATFTNKQLIRETSMGEIDFNTDYFTFVLHDAELRPQKTQEEMFQRVIEQNKSMRSACTPTERHDQLLQFRNTVWTDAMQNAYDKMTGQSSI